jgi:hypothetical protein
MKYRTRIYYTDAQKAVMWERWKEGWTLHQIAQLFNRPHNSVQGILSRTGGIRPPARSTSAATGLVKSRRLQPYRLHRHRNVALSGEEHVGSAGAPSAKWRCSASPSRPGRLTSSTRQPGVPMPRWARNSRLR